MKGKILDLLLAREGEFVSGEEMSKILGISRAGIWKHINRLREEGYRIESVTRLGHRLEQDSGPLNSHYLSRNLGTERLGCDFVVYNEVTSTNDAAKELAKSGADAGTVVVSERQNGGRGRRGRLWISPKGGIWMSVIFRPGLELKDVACYTLLGGVAVCHAIKQVTGLQTGIKWPNDILLNGKKVGGILTEVVGEWQAVDFLIMGIGINANINSAELPEESKATSLLSELGNTINLTHLIQTILQQLERLEKSLHKSGIGAVLTEWRQLAVCLGCRVIIKEHSSQWEAESIDIADDGALLVRDQQGRIVKVYSGEVSLRDKQGGYDFK